MVFLRKVFPIGFLAGLYDIKEKRVYRLPPTIILTSPEQEAAKSRLLREVARIAGNIHHSVYVEVSNSGWTNLHLFTNLLKKHIDNISDHKPPTVILVDDYTAHRTSDLPTNCDMHRIAGAFTPFIQVHDNYFKNKFKRLYHGPLKKWKEENPFISKVNLVHYAHEKTWKRYREGFLRLQLSSF